MNVEEDLKLSFRRQELAERQRRRQILLRQMYNEIALGNEPLSPGDLIINETVMNELAEVEEEHHRELHKRFGYWRRLWLAILGR